MLSKRLLIDAFHEILLIGEIWSLIRLKLIKRPKDVQKAVRLLVFASS